MMKLELSKVPRELKVILELLKDQEEEQLAEKSINLFHKLDWSVFVNLCVHHRVYPLIYPRLKELPSTIVPVDILSFFERKFKNNTFHMLYLSSVMEELSRNLLDEKIRVLFLKGPVIAHDLYGDLSMRTSSDLDFLVPLDKLVQAETVLQRMGFVKDEYIKTILGDWKWRHHHFTYFHPDKKIKAEIHWRLHPGPGREPGFEHLWMNKRRSSLSESPLFSLGKEDLFSFLVKHGGRHGWSRLRWLTDIQRILKQDVNWKTAEGLLHSFHSLKEGKQAVSLAAHLLDASIPAGIDVKVDAGRELKSAQSAIFYLENKINLHTSPLPEEISSYHAAYLFSLMCFEQKFLHLASFLFPFPEDAETLPLPLKYHSLYYILHPFLWTWRKAVKETGYLKGQKS
ncbi:nucleotidyltransferase domain-containing protein [Metabacillus sp. JX24]|uniref:nucleotidyltransferase domain-containing protein n=1 Tax=Metabacillus sp. JX24 TaxID=3240759 RepID=UPI00351082B5